MTTTIETTTEATETTEHTRLYQSYIVGVTPDSQWESGFNPNIMIKDLKKKLGPKPDRSKLRWFQVDADAKIGIAHGRVIVHQGTVHELHAWWQRGEFVFDTEKSFASPLPLGDEPLPAATQSRQRTMFDDV